MGATRSQTDDSWRVVNVETASTGDLGAGNCVWPGGGAPDGAVKVVIGSSADTADVEVGSPVRVFRRVEYGLYQESGRWWLGRRVGSATTYEKLMGPLRSQTAGGLEFRYFDAAGTTVTDPTQVAVVEIVLRAESARRVRPQSADAATFARDTLATKVALRGR